MLDTCKDLAVGLAITKCGVHSQTFQMELEIVARTHDCKCAGHCTEAGGVLNPYCPDDTAPLDEIHAHRISRGAILMTSFLYCILWMMVWHRYVRMVEGRYIAAGRPMGT